ncbi:MAG: pyruvate kinase [Sphaerochaetaceae bacterium]|jgi:pyruvate kinase|nr:pyruvate kinase [Sphaerochaetaceae bacterium]
MIEKMSSYTKIVATIGPASESYEIIRSCIEAGARVIRLNFSHGTAEEQLLRLQHVRKISEELQIPIAILQDLQGPKIRIGQLQESSYHLDKGQTIILTSESIIGDKKRVSIDYPSLSEEISIGSRILIDDGLIALRVTGVDHKEIHCVVEEGGTLRARKGVNLPNVPLKHLSSFTEKDKRDLNFAFEHDVDYVALSFVRSASDVAALRTYMNTTYKREIPIISKIEKPEAVEDLQGIIAQSSAIMVARGDLGVEMYPEEVPLIQKSIIRSCLSAGLPVITATQMLESMMNNPRPTRAETNDVANAVLDGTSAVMLSGESAAGKHPLGAVETMRRIVVHTEQSAEFKHLVHEQSLNKEHVDMARKRSTTDAVGLATREIALATKAVLIICFTYSGNTARLISKYRPSTPVIALSPIESTVRRLALSWGVRPFLIEHLSSIDASLEYAEQFVKEHHLAKQGDTVVVTAGVPVGEPGKTNMVKVMEIGKLIV